jgi:hypothetical protein
MLAACEIVGTRDSVAREIYYVVTRAEIQRRTDIRARLPGGENPFRGDSTYLTWEPPKELPIITSTLPHFLQLIYDQTTEDLRRLTSDGSQFLAYHVR